MQGGPSSSNGIVGSNVTVVYSAVHCIVSLIQISHMVLFTSDRCNVSDERDEM